MRWYYFHREADRVVLMKEGDNIPPRPEDANPATEGPMTPWYHTEDHFDETHVHVKAGSIGQACEKVSALLAGSTKVVVQTTSGSPHTMGPAFYSQDPTL